jgi:hypothetical protein
MCIFITGVCAASALVTSCILIASFCLNLLVDAKRFPNTDVDGVVDEMCNFRDESQHCSELNAQFQAFSTSYRLDTFWHAILLKSTYKKLWNVVQMLMLLSHGQASVERRFSFSKEIMTHNMKEQTLVAQRAVVGHAARVGGLDKMTIAKKMLLAAGSAKTSYNNYVAEEKEQNAKAQKRKALLDELEFSGSQSFSDWRSLWLPSEFLAPPTDIRLFLEI